MKNVLVNKNVHYSSTCKTLPNHKMEALGNILENCKTVDSQKVNMLQIMIHLQYPFVFPAADPMKMPKNHC